MSRSQWLLPCNALNTYDHVLRVIPHVPLHPFSLHIYRLDLRLINLINATSIMRLHDYPLLISNGHKPFEKINGHCTSLKHFTVVITHFSFKANGNVKSTLLWTTLNATSNMRLHDYPLLISNGHKPFEKINGHCTSLKHFTVVITHISFKAGNVKSTLLWTTSSCNYYESELMFVE